MVKQQQIQRRKHRQSEEQPCVEPKDLSNDLLKEIGDTVLNHIDEELEHGNLRLQKGTE